MTLRRFLKDFCIESIASLHELGEIPRPPFTAPSIATDSSLMYRLSRLGSHARLASFMRSSGITKRLHDIGHVSFWNEEPFPWLFLERVIVECNGTVLTATAFNKVMRRAQSEIFRPTIRTRQVTVIEGIPQFGRPVSLAPGTTLSSIDFRRHHYQLSRLLQWQYQDMNRQPQTWIGSGSCLLIQDRVIDKDASGEGILSTLELSRRQVASVLLAVKLSAEWTVFPKATFTSHLSSFPLLPLSREDDQEFRDVSTERTATISQSEIGAIKSNLAFLTKFSETSDSEPPHIIGAFYKFAESYRIRQEEQNIVDLVVILEALYGVTDEELKRRLSQYCALLLGTSERSSQEIFRKVNAAYALRNAVVHGRRGNKHPIVAPLKQFYPELRGKLDEEVLGNLYNVQREIRGLVRSSLRAYVSMRILGARKDWPTPDQLEALQFDSRARRKLQSQLNIRKHR